MKIYKNEAYSNGEPTFKGAEDVVVTEISDRRIHYRIVQRWDYGKPLLEQIRHSASIASFTKQYPEHLNVYD